MLSVLLEWLCCTVDDGWRLAEFNSILLLLVLLSRHVRAQVLLLLLLIYVAKFSHRALLLLQWID